MIPNSRFIILAKTWIIPLLISVIVFAIARPTLARIAGGNAGLTEFLVSNNIKIGDEIGANGFRQIYYIWQGNKNFITNTTYSNGHPDTEGEYITWMGQSLGGAWKIFLYHILTGITTQLSTSSNNANPKVSKGKVVWERWVGGGWQVFLFDGVRVLQLTEGDLSTDPNIEGDSVTYSRKNAAGDLQRKTHSIPSSASAIAPPTVTPEEIAKELGAIP
ncbi:TPA: hypothetical protein DIS56_00180 [Candidatus Saccharibacteria bacterium]|nr:hypothetical protein [Candidatus Saccharibacteria bacterium]